MFQAGRALSNTALWLDTCAFLTSEGIPVPSFISQSIHEGKINIFHKDWTNSNPSNLLFRGRRYNSLNHLLQAEVANGATISKNFPKVEAEIDRLISFGAVRKISHEDAKAEGSVINPIQLVTKIKPDGSEKVRLIIHSKMNVTFSKPKLRMPQINNELNYMANEEGLVKVDQSDCFYSG